MSWNFIIFLCTDAEGLVCIEILTELLWNQATKRCKKVLYHVQVCILMHVCNTVLWASPSDTLLINMYIISHYIHSKLLFVLITCRKVNRKDTYTSTMHEGKHEAGQHRATPPGLPHTQKTCPCNFKKYASKGSSRMCWFWVRWRKPSWPCGR